MSTERYLFLIKGSLVLAQPLAAQETGELLTSLLQQGFAVGPQPVWASNAEQALACYEAAPRRGWHFRKCFRHEFRDSRLRAALGRGAYFRPQWLAGQRQQRPRV